MSVLEKEIYCKMTKLFDTYKFKTYKETRENFIQMLAEYYVFGVSQNTNFLELDFWIRKKYNYFFPIVQSEKDIIQYMFKNILLNQEIPIDKIKTRYVDSFEEVEERMFYRIELYKHGWKVDKIEKYMYKHFFKQKIPIIDYDYFECLYYNVMIKHRILNQLIEKKIGRPSFPQSLKCYIKNKHYNKIKKNMRVKYKLSKEYEKIKDYLLTQDDIFEIKKSINNKTLIDKLEHLVVIS